MSEKRFKYDYGLIWNENGEKFDANECEGRRLVCNKLNEQQSTITKLKELNDDKGKRIISLIRTNKTLKEENGRLKEINKDKEQDVLHLYKKNEQLKHYKLYEDNKRLQTIIADLKEENEQLRKELDNFKPVMFQDVRKGTVILYSKGDIDE